MEQEKKCSRCKESDYALNRCDQCKKDVCYRCKHDGCVGGEHVLTFCYNCQPHLEKKELTCFID